MKRTPLKKGKPLRRIGKRGRRNAKTNRILKKEAERADIRYCELNYPGCTKIALSWAHSRRRRKFENDSDWTETLLSCWECHRQLDQEHSHEETEEIVKQVRAERETRWVDPP